MNQVDTRLFLNLASLECLGSKPPLLPLSEFDSIVLEKYQEQREKERMAELEIQLDIRFSLTRLSSCFTCDKDMNFLPSKVAEMGIKCVGGKH